MSIFYLALVVGVLVAAAACHGGGQANISLGDGTRYVNNSGGAQWVNLPDGSHVKISDGTMIVLWKGGRYVDLDGEGMFEVHASAAGPFVVHTGNLVIEALGTKFRVDAVRSRAGEEVDLLEGRLRIVKSYHSDSDNEPEQLEAGDMLMINREIDLMEKEKMNGDELEKARVKF